MTKRWIILGVLLTLLLAACGGGVSEDEAADALRAVYSGESATVADTFCEEVQASVLEGDALPQGVTLDDVECDRKGNTMVCTSTFELAADLDLVSFTGSADEAAESTDAVNADADEPETTEAESGDAETGDVGMSEEGTNTGEAGQDGASELDDQENEDNSAESDSASEGEAEAETDSEGDADAETELNTQRIVTRFALEDGELCGYRFE